MCDFSPQLQHLAAALRYITPQRCESQNKQHVVVSIHSSSAYGRSVGSVALPQRSVREPNFATTGPRPTDTIKCEVGRRALKGSCSRRHKPYNTPWTQMPRISNSSRTTYLSAQILDQHITQRSSRTEGVKIHTLTPINGSQCSDRVSKSICVS